MLSVLLTGCSGSVSVGGTTVKQADLEKAVADEITGADADKLTVSCDGSLKGEKGETQDCTLEDGTGDKSHVRAEVTKVDGDDVKFDTSLFVPADDVAGVLEEQLAGQGEDVESVTCADDLPGVVGEKIECTAEPLGDLTVTTTAVNGLVVNFNSTMK